MALLEKGDVDRALVEFRNVFKLNSTHRGARLAYANAERERGNLREAYAQYLRLVEQYPQDMEGLVALSEIAAQSGEWQEANRYVTTALALEPQNLSVQALRIVVDYGVAKSSGDDKAIDANAAKARDLLGKLPESLFLLGIVIDYQIRAQDYTAALATIDRSLALAPDDRGLYAMRLSTLAAMNDDAGVEAGLREMVGKFPDDAGIAQALVRWFVARKEIAKAEEFLRSRVDSKAPDQTRTLELVRFLTDNRGAREAVAELDRQIAAGNDSPVFRSARAGLLFDLGQRTEAVAEMRAILKDAPAGDDTRKIRIGLAQMLALEGNQVEARALVEEVLAEDGGNIEALKLKGAWLIQADEVGDALATLRQALDQNERNPEVLSLMADAYERDGNGPLMREMLSQAVDASDRAPNESLRYANVLVADGNLLTAETVLIEALKLAPGTPALLASLGNVYLKLKDWPRATSVADALQSLDDERARIAATTIRAEAIAGQQSSDQAIGYLQSLVDGGEGGLAAKLAIIRAHLANNQPDKALAYAETALAETPDDPSLRFVYASVQATAGKTREAEQTFRALLDEDKSRVPVWMALFRLVSTDASRRNEAGALLDQALQVAPEAPDLLWAKAGYLEQSGDIEGAVAVYEALYARDSGNLVIANNLASLLASYRSDAESLGRAEVIARRLKDSPIPAFQDTYGWIAHRRGNSAAAVPYLEKAAAGLQNDPMVQYHLGMAYFATGETAKARDALTTALKLVPADDARDFVKDAKDTLARINSGAPASGN